MTEPPDKPEAASTESQPASTIVASGERSIATGGNNSGIQILGNIINSVVTIGAGLPGWFQALVLAILVVTILTLIILVGPLVRTALQDAPPPAPDGTQLDPVGPLDLQVTALAADGDTVWVGAIVNARYWVYRLDARQGRNATLEQVLEVDAEVLGLLADCKHNLWIRNTSGTRVYQPQTGQHSTLINRATTAGWLPYNTMQTLASRCLATGEAEVWLGRTGIHTLRYPDDYPVPESIEYVPEHQDQVFLASQQLTDIRATLYMSETETLWAATIDGTLLPIWLKGVLATKQDDLGYALWSLAQDADGTVWAGGSQHLVQKNDRTSELALVNPQTHEPLTSAAVVIAVEPRGVWFGNPDCDPPSETCWPLGVYRREHFFQVPVVRKAIRGIVVAADGVWIGTEQGLIVYPAEAP